MINTYRKCLGSHEWELGMVLLHGNHHSSAHHLGGPACTGPTNTAHNLASPSLSIFHYSQLPYNLLFLKAPPVSSTCSKTQKTADISHQIRSIQTAEPHPRGTSHAAWAAWRGVGAPRGGRTTAPEGRPRGAAPRGDAHGLGGAPIEGNGVFSPRVRSVRSAQKKASVYIYIYMYTWHQSSVCCTCVYLQDIFSGRRLDGERGGFGWNAREVSFLKTHPKNGTRTAKGLWL